MQHVSAIPEDFRALLVSRTKISADQFKRLQGMSDEALDSEVRSAALIVRRFAGAVSEAVNDPDSAGKFLRELDLRLITRDHDWRNIFGELLASDEVNGAHNSTAISHYLSYLRSRHELLEYIHNNRGSLDYTDDMATQVPSPTGAYPGSVRLPTGTLVVVCLPYRGELTINLGRHRYKILDGCPPKLLDPNGRVLIIKRGRQLVGRHPSCDQVTHRDCRDVSRGHMYLEWRGDSRLLITDLSSQGTYLDPDCIETTEQTEFR